MLPAPTSVLGLSAHLDALVIGEVDVFYKRVGVEQV
jgi:hypothetical protein